ncbi:hypothetical protein H7J77_01500 [Mycolicibacillus parakoreensis]|uniref:Uncharacterized protein n=1 Tax=Mycolicibacillus parakoreensis TaxID=1069221 RepID=A0ABY3TZ18_9MYCO|nr:hypothetical protein [Mycolicibacillus parakoreensis]MCV7314225.1 hypothetical protein [Mycolicibacillus parakoreensis]ULN52940.1 hypothetical protein MIU77_00655 [Mycolicibacillus parakoreensis]HLR99553.1 hypothetical protein [Mycolicibacillus parakoreensis]
MADSLLQRQLDEVRSLAERARELFGANLIDPPTGFVPDTPDSAGRRRPDLSGR